VPGDARADIGHTFALCSKFDVVPCLCTPATSI